VSGVMFACALAAGCALGFLIGNEARVRVHRRWEDEWAGLVWHERHRAAWLESEAAALRAELTRAELALSEAKMRREATLEGETWPLN
jgi:hypothetical protein